MSQKLLFKKDDCAFMGKSDERPQVNIVWEGGLKNEDKGGLRKREIHV